MISITQYFGFARAASVATTLALNFRQAKLWAITPTGSGKIVTVPAPSAVPLGGPAGWVHNKGTDDLLLKTPGGVLLATLAQDDVGEVHLADVAGEGTWFVRMNHVHGFLS